ncbi:MAG: CooT family nickel-binding protein [Candidatus Abyssobacteria bacterium SURF_5]|uniref:CooT family nickel-binding protein n=1 Tax=Abyssobacteria bacterium (strain SURF_5) TaxID=2093360 RepID=A0A3A4P3F0_ABYX5|nr:MAG: CooT family nickel-binding protein [Candidatus Abyssubacteria bacterium SURF_5]
MCEANAYFVEDGKEQLYLESVDIIRPEGDSVYLLSVFGEQKKVNARLKEIRLMDHKIILEKS